MAVKSFSSLGKNFIQSKPKKTKQGQGTNSKPRHNKKMSRGQGK